MKLTMSNFSIDIVDKYTDYTNYITLTSYKDNNSSIFSSYDEEIEEKEYSQFSLSFKVELFANGMRNPYISYLTHGRQLRLTLNEDNIIFFNIVGITPTFGVNGIEYSYSCQDSFSYQWSKQSIDINFSTNDSSIWDSVGPKSIYHLLEKLLEISHLHYQWSVDAIIGSSVVQFPDDLYQNKGTMKISVDLQGTPYSILTQILNTFNATLTVDYKKNTIFIQNKEKIQYKGFMLNSSINLSNFNYSETSSDICNIMFVSGGTDEYGTPVTLIEPVPTELFDLFLNLDSENLQDVSIAISDKYDYEKIISCYPDFYVKKDTDGSLVVYCKEYDEVTGEFSYQKSDLNYKNWREAKNVMELKSILKEYYNQQKWRNVKIDNKGTIKRMNIYSNYNKYFVDFSNFFTSLEKIPHYGSFLVNFDYWKGKSLSSQRYSDLEYLFNIKLRNINLMNMIYNSIYSNYKYNLTSLVQQEEEVINHIANLLHEQAFFKEDHNKETSLYSYYVSQSREHEWEDSQLKKQTDYYLPIAEWTPEYNKNIYYGMFLSARATVPTLDQIGAIQKLYYRTSNVLGEDDWHEIPVASIDYINNAIILQEEFETSSNMLIYLKISETGLQQSLKDINISQDTVNINEVDSLLFQLHHNIWNEDYYDYQFKLYGTKWYENKLLEIEKQLVSKKTSYQTAIENMVYHFGHNWRNVDVAWIKKNNPTKFITYSNLKKEIDTLSIYVGGMGTRKYGDDSYYQYPGYLNLYKKYIETDLIPPSEDDEVPSLQDKIDKYSTDLKDWWSYLYKNYSDIIQESNFSDEDQLSNSGLYSSALKQFLQYNQPTKSYNASFLSSENLEGTPDEVAVGDTISLHQEFLREQMAPKTITVELDDYAPSFSSDNDIVIEYQLPKWSNVYASSWKSSVRGLAFGDGHWVAICNDKTIWTSSNKKDWTKADWETDNVPTKIVYNGIVFVIVDYGGIIYSSTKPTSSWMKVDSGIDYAEGVEFLNGQWLVYGEDSGTAAISYLEYDDKYPEWEFNPQPPIYIPGVNMIKQLLYYEANNTYYIITSNSVLTMTHMKDDIQFVLHLSESLATDIRAAIIFKNYLFLGGENIGILKINIDDLASLAPETIQDKIPSVWKQVSIPTLREKDIAFVRDFGEINNTIYAAGYWKHSELKNISGCFAWQSTDIGETWQNIDLLLDNNNLFNAPNSIWKLCINDSNLVFATESNIVDIQNDPRFISGTNVKFINKYRLELTIRDDTFQYSRANILSIKYNGLSYSEQSLSPHILSITPKFYSEDIKMKINGIKKKLRSNTASLTVEENTMYNTLVDRLLYFLRYD